MCLLNALRPDNPIRMSVSRTLLVGLAFIVCVLIAPGLGAADVPFADGAVIADGIPELKYFSAADVDGDGFVDVLAAGSKYYDNQIALWRNTSGDGSAWEKSTISDSFDGANSAHTGDVNDDGWVDVIASAYHAADIAWWENGGNGSFTKYTIEGNFVSVRNIHSADVDGDGDLDVLGAAGLPNDLIAWWENPKENGGISWTYHKISSFKDASSVMAADVDGDGDFDAIGSSLSDFGIAWWENEVVDGEIVWIPHTVDAGFERAEKPYPADLDGDGDLDVLGAASVEHDVTWWENTVVGGEISWIKHTIDGTSGLWASVRAADLDDDGDLDILGTALGGDDVTWWENTGGDPIGWQEHTINDGSGFYSRKILAADLDRDGDLDVLGGSWGSIVWWENLTPGEFPEADFSWDPVGPEWFEPVRFSDESRFDPAFSLTGLEWTFDDGTTSQDPNPTHVFDAVGDYEVMLWVENINGDDQITQTVHVAQRQIPLADFSWEPDPPMVGQSVQFGDKSSFEPTGWEWDIGNDGQPDSDLRSPVPHTFQTPGFKEVKLTVTNAYGSHFTVKEIEVLPDPDDPINPYVSKVTRDYPGFFLQGTDVENTFDVSVDWQGTDPSRVEFKVDDATVGSVNVNNSSDPVDWTFHMANDFDADLTASTVEITPYYVAGGEPVPGITSTETVYVFPYPAWLELAGGSDAVTIAAENGEVTASFYAEFPYPHLAEDCSPDSEPPYGDCRSIPESVPLFGGTFDLAETYAAFEGSVSSKGSGSLSLFGQTGFCALKGCVMGSAWGAGAFSLNSPGGLEITSAIFNLHLEGVLSKEITVTEIPQFTPLTTIPVIGRYIKKIGDRATLLGQIAPYLDVSASWAQDADSGKLAFASAEGTLGLDLLAMLTLDLGRLSVSAWIAGGGSFTLGLPDPPPLIRAAEIHAQLGIKARLDLLFDITLKAKLDIGCGYLVDGDPPWDCYLDLNKAAPSLLEEADGVRVIKHDYARFGEYAVFKAAPVARTKSSKVPISVAETKMVSNLFPGASPAIVEAGSGRLLVWEHQDTVKPELQSTDIAWSFHGGSGWSETDFILPDYQAEFSPVLGADADGNIVAAWLRIKEEDFSIPIDDASKLPKFYKLLEVVSAFFDPVAQSWYDITPLTDDDSMDTDLRLVADASGNIMLTWLSNPDGAFYPTEDEDPPVEPSSLMYSIWENSKFSEPDVVAGDLFGVSSHASAISGDDRVVLVPRDPDPLVIGDEVIDRYNWDGVDQVWRLETTHFAEDGDGNRAPSVVFASIDGEVEGHVVWLRGNDLVKATLSDSTPTMLRSGSASLAFLGARLLNSPDGNITLLWQEAVDNQPADIFAMIYDPFSDTWSKDRRLNDAEELVHQASAAYDSDGVLHAAYLTTVIERTSEVVEIEGQEWTMTNVPVEGQTDLVVMEHSLVFDLAVDDDDLTVMPVDEGNTVTLTVHNAGDFATASFVVDLFIGDPTEDNESVASQTVPGPFLAGDSQQVDFDYTYSEPPGNLVAVVDAGGEVNEITEDNNTATLYLDNRPPIAVVTADPTSGEAPLTVFFDGSLSYEPDGDATTHRWAFADGTAGETGGQVTHTFDTGGLHPVTLSVTDQHGAVGTAVVVINVDEPSTPEGQMAATVAFYEAGLDDGSIYGLGNKPTARERHFRKILDAAADLIAAGDDAGACRQLDKAVARSDGMPAPPDLIGGTDVPALNSMLIEIMVALGC